MCPKEPADTKVGRCSNQKTIVAISNGDQRHEKRENRERSTAMMQAPEGTIGRDAKEQTSNVICLTSASPRRQAPVATQPHYRRSYDRTTRLGHEIRCVFIEWMVGSAQHVDWEEALVGSNDKELVATIVAQLGETQGAPIGQIHRIVQRLGRDKALAFLEETKQIEAQGGMLLADGSRRRTPGGVYFQLIKSRIATEDRVFIFPVHWQKLKRAKRAINEALPSSRTRVDPNELPHLDGKVRAVKITLIGRPGPIKVVHNGCIMTTMLNATPPSFPKGLPTPLGPAASFTVYIAPKQWNKVAEALKNPEDTLIVEGWPTYDPVLNGIAVYVLNTTTRELQRQQRAQQER